MSVLVGVDLLSVGAGPARAEISIVRLFLSEKLFDRFRGRSWTALRDVIRQKSQSGIDPHTKRVTRCLAV